MLINNANPNVDERAFPEGHPYRVGFQEGIEFQRAREENLRKLDADKDTEFIHVKISRKVWRACNALWQEDTKNPNTFMSPEQLLYWITFRYQELKYFNTFAEAQGRMKGWLKAKGIDVRTGQL